MKKQNLKNLLRKFSLQGGLGAKPSEKLNHGSAFFIGGVISHPILARKKRYKYWSTKGLSKNSQQAQANDSHGSSKSYRSNIHKLSQPVPAIFALLISLSLTGCSSTQKRDRKIVRVLERQHEVLTALKNERKRPALVEAISQNDESNASEKLLNDALKELEKSNEVLQSALKKEK